jgi:hypothetical protein
MAKRIDPLKAKEAKQKKIAIVGALLLLAVLAFQGPKTLKMLKGPQRGAQTAPATVGPGGPAVPDPVVGGPATGGAATPGGTPAAPVAADLAAVADSDSAPEPEQGQLATFERFASKDPFAQQAQEIPAPPPPAPPKDEDADETTTTPAEPADGGSGEGDGSDAGFTSGDPAAVAPERATATSIAVNGEAEDVDVDGSFPKDSPTFVLASIAKDGKSVRIGIAGGSYASGDETLKLALGKKISLQNTADGSRYELELLSIEGFPLPKQK